MKDNKSLIATMENSLNNYTNAIILVPTLVLLSAEISAIIQSTHGTKEQRKKVIKQRIEQAIENMIIKMPYLSDELTQLKKATIAALI